MRRSSFLRIRELFEGGAGRAKDKQSVPIREEPSISSTANDDKKAQQSTMIKGPFHPHALVWTCSNSNNNDAKGFDWTGHVCDYCFSSIQLEGWHCTEPECGTDVCGKCLPRDEKSRNGSSRLESPLQGHEHHLEWNSFPDNDAKCSACEASTRSIGSWDCRTCETSTTSLNRFVLCNDCRIAKEAVNPIEMGISLRLLRRLSGIFHDQSVVDELCSVIKDRTKQDEGYRSFAMNLFRHPLTRRFVQPRADVFVSYAWKGRVKATMEALCSQLLPASGDNDDEDVFIWMDVAIVDQHRAAETNVDFDEWAKTFKGNLLKTKKAVLVLTPGRSPIAVSRSWCCFEWVCIVQSGIPFEYCVNPNDARELIFMAKNGLLRANFFANILARINIERATAFKEFDQRAILGMMRETGVVKVNDIIMNSIKQWLMAVMQTAQEEARAESNDVQLAEILIGKGQLHYELVSSCFHRLVV